jgi:hypothetical protein
LCALRYYYIATGLESAREPLLSLSKEQSQLSSPFLAGDRDGDDLDLDSSIVFKWVILRVLENVGKWMTKYKSSSLDSINTVDNNSVLAVVL